MTGLVLQLLEESRVYQVVPFMTHLELNHIKDDKADSDKAHKGQEAVKMVNAGLQPEYKGRFKLQVHSLPPLSLVVEDISCPVGYLQLLSFALISALLRPGNDEWCLPCAKDEVGPAG